MDAVGVEHDQALRRLAEDLGQADHRHRAGRDHVAQHRARTDRRQLIDVADQAQARRRRQRGDQVGGQPHVEHRRLVDDQQVDLERAVGAAAEAPLVRPPLEQPVQRRRRRAGRLRQALRRAARRRGQRDAQPLARQDRHHAAHDRGLADAGAAGDHHDLAAERAAHRLGLLARQRDARLLLVPGERAIDVELHRRRRRGQQAAQPGRRGDLGLVEAGLVDRRAAVERRRRDARVDRRLAGARQTVDRRVGHRLGDAEQARRLAREALARHEHVALAGRFFQHVAHAGGDAHRRLLFDAQRRRELVGRQKADAPHVERQPVGVLAHARDRGRAVALVDARRERRRDAVALQEHHHLAHLALAGPRLADRSRARRADAGDLADAARVAVEHLERGDPEPLDDAPRELGADALDQPRAEVAANAVQRRGRDLGVARHPKLGAEAHGVLEAADHAQRRTDRHARQAADDGDHLAARARLQACDGEVAFAAGEDDALDGALEGFLAGFALAVAGGRGARAVEQIHADEWSMKARPQQRRRAKRDRCVGFDEHRPRLLGCAHEIS